MTENVIVLGGGVIGLATAFELRLRGFNVTLLEKNTCGGQASGAAAGMLAPFSEIEEDNDEFFELCLKSLRLFPEWQKKVKEISKSYFEYTNSGSIHAIYHEADLLVLETTKKWHQEHGVEAEIYDINQLKKKEPNLSNEIVAGLYYPEESHIYAPDYVKALYQGCRNLGVHMEENLQEIEVFSWKNDIVLKAANGQIYSSDYLVVSPGAWAKELEIAFKLQIPVFPIRGQICAYKVPVESLNHIIFSSQGYLVRKESGVLVCGATEDIAGFDTSVTQKGIERLENWNPKILPMLKDMKPFHTWAGLRPATQDGYPLLGKLSRQPRVIFATGHYRNGILLSPVTAKVVADIIGNEHRSDFPSIELFSPERFS